MHWAGWHAVVGLGRECFIISCLIDGMGLSPLKLSRLRIGAVVTDRQQEGGKINESAENKQSGGEK